MTLRYSHLSPSHKKTAMEAMARKFMITDKSQVGFGGILDRVQAEDTVILAGHLGNCCGYSN